jgi:O-antigen/teichoic acid export membrane protein
MPKTSDRSFLRHAATYGVGVLLLQAGGILLLPLYTRFLGPGDYGLLQLWYRTGDILSIGLMVNGIRLATFNLWGTSTEGPNRDHIAASVSSIIVVIVFAGASLAAIGVRAFDHHFAGVDGTLVFAGISAILLQALTVTPLAVMQARMQSRAYVVATAGITISQIVLTVITLVVLNLGIWGVILSLSLTHTVWGVGLTIRELRRTSFAPRRDQITQAVRFSSPFVPTGLFFFVLHSGDQFFLAKYAGAAVLGVYALAYRIAGSVTVLATQPLQQVWVAYMYEAFKQPDRALIFGRVYTRVLAVYLLVGVAVVVFRAEAISIFATSLFAGAAKVIGLLVLAHFFWVLSTLADSAFYVSGKTNLKPRIAAASMVVTLCSYAWLIPTHLGQGAAMATLIGYSFHSIATVLVAQRVFWVRFEYFRVGALLCLAALTVAVAERLGDGAGFAPLKIALILSLPGQAWILGLWSTDEKRWIIDRARQWSRTATRWYAKRNSQI